MKLTQFLLLCSSALAVKVPQVDTMGGLYPEEVELAETDALTPEDIELSELESSAASPSSFKSTVVVKGGKKSGSRTYLSTDKRGSDVDLWKKDDGSGRQRWSFKRVAGTVDQYVVTANGKKSKDRTILSTPNCGKDYVDLWSKDGGDGKQRWKMTHTGQPNTFTLQIVNGRNGCSKNLLGTGYKDKDVDLYQKDEGNGRQQWVIKDVHSEITTIQGSWIEHGRSNTRFSKNLDKGIYGSNGQALTTSQADSYSLSSNTSFVFGNKQVTGGVSNGVTYEADDMLARPQQRFCPASCNNGALYQWVSRATTNFGEQLSFKTCHYACSNGYPSYTPYQ